LSPTAALGLGFKHIDSHVVGILTFVFAITSVASTYMIQYNHEIQLKIAHLFQRFGFKDIDEAPAKEKEADKPKEIVFLGFFREASSIFHEIESMGNGNGNSLMKKILVVDFNPVVHSELNKRDVKCIYGDISSVDTLKHAQVDRAHTIVCTIPDYILRGTTNERLLHLSRHLCPGAQVIVTANALQAARNLYDQGADFVFIPRIHSARYIAGIISESQSKNLAPYREKEIASLSERHEVLG
jgi:voltage-gated potassium channel Kch